MSLQCEKPISEMTDAEKKKALAELLTFDHQVKLMELDVAMAEKIESVDAKILSLGAKYNGFVEFCAKKNEELNTRMNAMSAHQDALYKRIHDAEQLIERYRTQHNEFVGWAQQWITWLDMSWLERLKAWGIKPKLYY